MVVEIILKYLYISILISVIFGVTILSGKIIERVKRIKFLCSYLFQLWSLLIFMVLWFFYKSKIEIFEVSRLANWNNVVLVIITVIPTSLIVNLGNRSATKGPFRFVEFINGASMEIPQRLLVQNMFMVLNINIVIYGSMTLAILLNALIWAQFIIVQQLICCRKVTKRIIPEIAASVWFSIWVGILYSITGNIIVSMLTHGLERLVAYLIKKSFNKGEVNSVI